MRSKDYLDQIKTDKQTLKELYLLDSLNYKLFSKFGKINLLSTVIVQAQSYISSSIINKKIKPYDKNDYFPFATSRYLNNQKKFKEKTNNKLLNKNLKKKIKNLRSLIPFTKISTFNVFSEIYENLKQDLDKKLLFRNVTSFKPLYLNFLDEQIKILNTYLETFSKKNNIKNKKFSENFISYIKPFFCYEKNKIDKNDFLLVGSNAILENRVMSANFISNKKKVISFNHANYNTLIINEPHQEYTEHAFCDYYVDYGSIKMKKKELKSDYLKPKKIIRFSSSRFEKITFKKNIPDNKVIYIPDSFNGDKRQGPYREMDDEKYYNFQNRLNLSNKNIFIKRHPKGAKLKEIITKKRIKIFAEKNIKEDLSKIFNKHSLFIVDRISQAFFEIARGGSKILYFNIGRRKIRKDVINEIKKRAFVVNIDPYTISSAKISSYIKKAKNFKPKKSSIINLACTTDKKNKQIFLDIFNS